MHRSHLEAVVRREQWLRYVRVNLAAQIEPQLINRLDSLGTWTATGIGQLGWQPRASMRRIHN